MEENDSGSEDEFSFRKVTFCRVESQEELKANPARRLEAENLARWLHEEVLGKARIRDRTGEWIAVQPRHVALRFRKLTEVHLYLEPPRRSGKQFVLVWKSVLY